MLPSHSGILAEAINTKILTKNHPDSPIPTLIFRIPIPIPWIPTLIPRIPHIPYIPTPIPRIPTLISRVLITIPRVPTLIPRVPIIPLIMASDHLSYKNVSKKFTGCSGSSHNIFARGGRVKDTC